MTLYPAVRQRFLDYAGHRYPIEVQTCRSKNRYLTYASAARDAAQYDRRVYGCPFCDRWHTTSKKLEGFGRIMFRNLKREMACE